MAFSEKFRCKQRSGNRHPSLQCSGSSSLNTFVMTSFPEVRIVFQFCLLYEFIGFLLSLLAGITVTFLDPADQFVSFTANERPIVVCQLGPPLLGGSFELFP